MCGVLCGSVHIGIIYLEVIYILTEHQYGQFYVGKDEPMYQQIHFKFTFEDI